MVQTTNILQWLLGVPPYFIVGVGAGIELLVTCLIAFFYARYGSFRSVIEHLPRLAVLVVIYTISVGMWQYIGNTSGWDILVLAGTAGVIILGIFLHLALEWIKKNTHDETNRSVRRVLVVGIYLVAILIVTGIAAASIIQDQRLDGESINWFWIIAISTILTVIDIAVGITTWWFITFYGAMLSGWKAEESEAKVEVKSIVSKEAELAAINRRLLAIKTMALGAIATNHQSVDREAIDQVIEAILQELDLGDESTSASKLAREVADRYEDLCGKKNVPLTWQSHEERMIIVDQVAKSVPVYVILSDKERDQLREYLALELEKLISSGNIRTRATAVSKLKKLAAQVCK